MEIAWCEATLLHECFANITPPVTTMMTTQCQHNSSHITVTGLDTEWQLRDQSVHQERRPTDNTSQITIRATTWCSYNASHTTITGQGIRVKTQCQQNASHITRQSDSTAPTQCHSHRYWQEKGLSDNAAPTQCQSSHVNRRRDRMTTQYETNASHITIIGLIR